MYLLPEQLRKELLDYLASRPYVEVAKAIQLLASLQEHKVEPKEVKKEEKK